MGLVTPIERGENNYRYYSHSQITSTNLINTLQSLGMSLKEIMELIRRRTPGGVSALFARQGDIIKGEIERLERSRKLLSTLREMVDIGLAADEDVIEARVEDEESVYMGPQMDYSGGKTIEEATLDFYEYCMERDPDMDMNYPVWGFFSEERVKNRDWYGPDKFYFWMPDAPDRKPQGLYAVGYTRGYYGHCDDLYRRMIKFIADNGFEVCGPAWEMYPLNEISIVNKDNYLIKVSISIKRA
jgi:DNA-binding transcriptional MerR regulator